MSRTTSSSDILESISNAIVDITEKTSPSVVRIGSGRWRGGTGTVWSRDGHIVTSNHVVGGMREVEVGLSDGTRHTAKVVGRDPYSDVALLKVDSDRLTPVETGNSDSLKVGQFVLAIANPLGKQPAATSGIVTNPSYSVRGWWTGALDKVVVTDARLNPGYSGGPLVDARGRVVGINAAYANNRGISVPVNTVKNVVKLNTYILDVANRPAYREARKEVFGDHECASTMVQISALASPDRNIRARSDPDRSQSSVTKPSLRLDDPGHLEPPVLDLGRPGQGLILGEAWLQLVGAENVALGDGVSRGCHVLGGHLTDPLGILQDQAELSAEPLPLLVGE